MEPIKLELSVTDLFLVREYAELFKLNGFRLRDLDTD